MDSIHLRGGNRDKVESVSEEIEDVLELIEVYVQAFDRKNFWNELFLIPYDQTEI